MRLSAFIAVILLASCATAPMPTVEQASGAEPLKLSPGVAWVAEGQGWAQEAREVFAEASAYAESVAAARPEKSWAVVLDLDETVLNNVDYQISREAIGEGFTPESWHAWTQEARATLVPGAEEFIAAVNAAGGHVAFVTNRTDTEQLATENNLAALGLKRGEDFQVLLTRAIPKAPSEKDGRFAIVPSL
nr:hypothetical protein [Hyphomonas sp.]